MTTQPSLNLRFTGSPFVIRIKGEGAPAGARRKVQAFVRYVVPAPLAPVDAAAVDLCWFPAHHLPHDFERRKRPGTTCLV